MIPIDGYRVHTVLHEESRYSLFAASSMFDARPVTIKYLPLSPVREEERIRISRKAERAIHFRSDHVVRLLDVRHIRHHEGEGIALVFETRNLTPVRSYLGDPPVNVMRFLAMAIQLAEAVNDFHRQGFVHHEIKPSAIGVLPETETVFITDMGFHTLLSHEDRILYNADVLNNALPYVSPEQTGRMNRQVDYRTDFYSLGVTFYELLTGAPPFRFDDPIKTIHGHVTEIPAPPATCIAEIPSQVSDIVMKLLSKNPEERYQSAFGLIADLERCRREIQSQSLIRPFPLGGKDKPEEFRVSSRFHGRTEETRSLMEGLRRAQDGRMSAMMIAGPSGIGKSRLAHEIASPASRAGFLCAFGKYEQLGGNIPYSAILQAFSGLIRQILTQSSDRIEDWKRRFTDTLGLDRSVMIEAIPELALIIGESPSVPPLPPDETRSRFQRVFSDFARVCADRDHPLLLFLDDMQWADPSSLLLIQHILISPKMSHALFIGAHRNLESEALHPLTRMLNSLVEQEIRAETIVLDPLEEADIRAMIADSLRQELIRVHPLAQIVRLKTGGNPFFIEQFLQSLAASGLIAFDHAAGEWRWDAAAIENASITENVADLMASRMKTLPEHTRACLENAACIGSRFTLEMLAVVSDQTIEETGISVWKAIEEGLLIPLEDAYRYLIRIVMSARNRNYMDATDGPPPSSGIRIAFLHDRIQQAAYDLIPRDRRQSLHLRIARLLMAKTPPESLKDMIFDIVHPYNKAESMIVDPDEKLGLARLNAQAARKARAMAAFSQALDYYTSGCRLLAPDVWRNNYDLAMELHSGCAECASLTGDYRLMETMTSGILRHATDPLDSVLAHEIRIQAFNARDLHLDAIRLGISVLRDLGIRFPDRPRKYHILVQVLRTRLLLSRWNMKTLLNFPEMKDPVQKTVIRILASIATAAYMANPKYYPLFVLRVIDLSLKHGYTPETPLGYQSLSVLLCGLMGNIDKGFAYGRLSLQLAERMPRHRPKVIAIFNAFIRIWKENIRETFEPLIEAYEESLRNGDIEYAGYALYTHLNHALLSGIPLSDVRDRFNRRRSELMRMNNSAAQSLFTICDQMASNLQGGIGRPGLLRSDGFDEREMLPRYLAANNRAVLFAFYLVKTILHFLFGELSQARDCAENAGKYKGSAISIFASAVFVFYETLVLTAVFPDLSRFEQIRAGQRIRSGIRRMKRWAAACPSNFMGKHLILDAGWATLHGHHDSALKQYDNAISFSIKQGLPGESALANELAANSCLSRGRLKTALPYLLDALREYERWGAAAKIADLKKKHAQLLGSPFRRRLEKSFPRMAESDRENPPDVLDSTALIEALQAISGEIELDRLIDRLMNILMENAGAGKAALLFEQNGELLLAALNTTDQKQMNVAMSASIPKASKDLEAILPVSMIRYVLRTRETISSTHSRMNISFRNDPYLVKASPKSVLCLPAMRQSNLIGVLYLENALTEEAFSSQRIEILRMIASQAAVSLENARLYNTLKQEVAERKKTEAILWENEKRFRLLAENATDIIGMLDFDLAFTYISPSVQTALGYAPEEIKGSHLEHILAPESLKTTLERYHRNLSRIQEGRFPPGKLELEFVARDGAHRIMEATVSVIHDETHHPLNLLMVARDITERKTTEETIRTLNVTLEQRVAERTRELEQSLELIKTAQDRLVQSEKLASLGGLVAGIAHEINTPVGVGVTAASFLADETAKFASRFREGRCDDFGVEKYIKIAGEASSILLGNMHRAAELISSFKQVAVDQSREERRKFNLKSCLNDLMLSLQPRYKRTGHRIDIECPDNIEINSYPGAFSQIFTNLIVNSLMHGFEGIKHGEIHIRMFMDNEGLSILYKDNGVGVPPESLKRIFDPFYTTKRGLGGSGLGMHIVYNLVTQKLNGRIVCSSKPSEGMTFEIRIPAASLAPSP